MSRQFPFLSRPQLRRSSFALSLSLSLAGMGKSSPAKSRGRKSECNASAAEETEKQGPKVTPNGGKRRRPNPPTEIRSPCTRRSARDAADANVCYCLRSNCKLSRCCCSFLESNRLASTLLYICRVPRRSLFPVVRPNLRESDCLPTRL